MTHLIRRESRDDKMVRHAVQLDAWEDDGGATAAEVGARDVPSEGRWAADARLFATPRTSQSISGAISRSE
jgi:hypothetical protein